MKKHILASLVIVALSANAFAAPQSSVQSGAAPLVAEGGADRVGVNRVAADGADRVGARPQQLGKKKTLRDARQLVALGHRRRA